mmetsp:Transcript_6112/g.24411  ORF Transcript_6112/g.24411 Transcript_6112/m.24411 type:complete len:241 (+) Transcript_6112:1896-2618(+)
MALCFSLRPRCTCRSFFCSRVYAARASMSRASRLALALLRRSWASLARTRLWLRMALSCATSVAALRSSLSMTTARRCSRVWRLRFFSIFGLDLNGSSACSALGTLSDENLRGARSTALYTESALSGGASPASRRICPTVRMPLHSTPGAASMVSVGTQNLGTSTGTHARRKTMSESSSLSSNVQRHAPSPPPSVVRRAFLIWPRTPDTVRTLAPSNLATSSALLNMSLMKAVFLNVLKG